MGFLHNVFEILNRGMVIKIAPAFGRVCPDNRDRFAIVEQAKATSQYVVKRAQVSTETFESGTQLSFDLIIKSIEIAEAITV
jgi:transcriptional regulator NrdR family protein